MKLNRFSIIVFIFLVFLTIGTIVYILNGVGTEPVPVLEPDPTEPPVTIFIPMVSKPESVYVPPEAAPLIYIPDQIVEHSLDQHDIRVLARLLWSSPLRDDQEKRKLLWVVFNRMDDDSGIFGDTIDTVVIRREFAFYESNCYISKVNTQIVTEELNKYLSLHQGYHITRPIPANHVYCDFSGYAVKTYPIIGR